MDHVEDLFELLDGLCGKPSPSPSTNKTIDDQNKKSESGKVVPEFGVAETDNEHLEIWLHGLSERKDEELTNNYGKYHTETSSGQDHRCYPEWLCQLKDPDPEYNMNEVRAGFDVIEFWLMAEEKRRKQERDERQRPDDKLRISAFQALFNSIPRAPTTLKKFLPNPPGPYPWKASTYEQFLDMFRKEPKLHVIRFRNQKIWKYPPGHEWTCRVVNLNTHYNAYEVHTLDFEWDDHGFQEDHRFLEAYMNHVYSYVKLVPDFKFQFVKTEDIPEADRKIARGGVVDLGERGFHRCRILVDDFDMAGGRDEVLVNLIDKNLPMIVPISSIYQCLLELEKWPARYNDMFLYKLIHPHAVACDLVREKTYKYFKECGTETRYKVVVRFWNMNGVPIVDVFTVDSPPAYVNDLIEADIIACLPGPRLPKAPSGLGDVLIPHIESTGEIALQVMTCESDWFTDITTEYNPEQVKNMIKEYQSWGPTPLNKNSLYYTTYFLDQVFYRVKLLTLEDGDENGHIGTTWMKAPNGNVYTSTKGQLLAFFIDFGNVGLVDPNEMIPVDFVHPALGRFKPQCIMAQLKNLSKLRVKDFYHLLRTDQIVNIEVIRDGDAKALPVVDVILNEEEPRGQTRLSEILRDQEGKYWKPKSDVECVSPYERLPGALDSLEIIDTKRLCWSRPPQMVVMVEGGAFIRVKITDSLSPHQFTIFSPENWHVWVQMEDELTKWVDFFDPGRDSTSGFQEYDYPEQKFYSWFDKKANTYMRVLYVEEHYHRDMEFADLFKPRPTNTSKQEVTAYAIDHAKIVQVKKGHLRLIGRQFCSLPPGAAQAGIVQKGEWTDYQKRQFSRAMNGKTFWFRVKDVFYSEVGVPYVSGEFFGPEEVMGQPIRKLSLDELGLSVSLSVPITAGPSNAPEKTKAKMVEALPPIPVPKQIYVPPPTGKPTSEPVPGSSKGTKANAPSNPRTWTGGRRRRNRRK